VPGAEGSEPRGLTVFHDRIFFTARSRELGRELWASDGSAEGTVLVMDIDPRPGRGSDPELLTVHGDLLYFPAAEPEQGRELWVSDGSEAGTRLAAEVTPGSDGLFMTHLISSGTHLYFSGGPASTIEQGVWVSDGTTASTRQVGPRLINVDSRPIAFPGVFDGQLFFATEGDQLLWRSDGTEEGTAPLLSAFGQEIDEPEAYQLFAGRLFFTAGGILYETDGTSAATLPLLRLAGPAGSGSEASSFELAPAGGRLLFRAWDRLTGSELWALDGESGGAVLGWP
jgi:ELWxxDGT repeat protein